MGDSRKAWTPRRTDPMRSLCTSLIAFELVLLLFNACRNGRSQGLVAAWQNRTPGENASSHLVDPCLGIMWTYIFDRSHPERPPRLTNTDIQVSTKAVTASVPTMIVRSSARPSVWAEDIAVTEKASEKSLGPVKESLEKKVILPGDSLVVFQREAWGSARFDAVALEPGVIGRPFQVRLKLINGGGRIDRVISVLATGPGEAKWPIAYKRPAQ